MRLPGHVRFHHLHQARFADAGLPAQHHDLPTPLLHLRPALQQQPHFLLAAHQRRQRDGTGHVEAALCPPFTHDLVDRHWRREAFERLQAKGAALIHPLDEPGSSAADHQTVRLGERLQAGGQVWGLSQG